MKKSILMAIVALALLAAPAFAGDYSIVGNIDWGFGFGLGAANTADVTTPASHAWVFGDDDNNVATPDVWYDRVTPASTTETEQRTYNVTNDFTMLGFFGSIDANNSIGITMEYGASGGASFIDGPLAVEVTDFNLTTNVLGAFGLTDLPVTLFLSAGHGRLNLHNRFQQWTGWEIKRWKNNGAAHFAGSYSADDPGVWQRANYVKLTAGIMNMVNVSFGMVPYFNAVIANSEGDFVADVPVMIDVWTSGITVGPAALDIAANLRSDSLQIRTGIQVTANMNFGALALMAFVGEDYHTSVDSTIDEKGWDNGLYIAVKPSYNFGAGTIALGAWLGLETEYLPDPVDEATTYMALAIDVAASFSTFTIYGGVLVTDLSGEIDDDQTPMKYDIGVKNAFGAATIGLGVTGIAGTEDGTGVVLNDWDIGAADGSGNNWLDEDGNAVPTLYFRVSAWY